MSEPVEPLATLPQTPGPFKVLAFYRFAALPDCAALQPRLAKFCCARRIRGTFILAPEGINGTVAGTPEAIADLARFLADDPIWAGRLAGAEAKYSEAADMPFHRMKVRLKPEIVTLRAPEADPSRRVGTYVAPRDWNALISRNDVTLIDTRNAYEVELGTFANAANPGTANFTAFKAYVDTLDPARHGKVAMFCTGGIRCEKASAYMLSRGFSEVFHLKGGILSYLEQVPEAESRFHGECFVFDERVALTHGLAPGRAVLCRACRMPTAPEALVASASHPESGLCPACAARAARAQDGEHDGAAERNRQIALATARGDAHLGDAATETARRNKARKATQHARTRQHQTPGQVDL